jgi:hypothetical protein
VAITWTLAVAMAEAICSNSGAAPGRTSEADQTSAAALTCASVRALVSGMDGVATAGATVGMVHASVFISAEAAGGAIATIGVGASCVTVTRIAIGFIGTVAGARGGPRLGRARHEISRRLGG